MAWADGGRTAADHLAHLCHHRLLKHREGPLGRWRVVHLDPQRQDGVLEWTSPAGQVHRTYPQEHHRSDPRPCPPEDPPPWTVCPSEAARALAPAGWRELMEDVRQEAYRLADDGLVDITQRDRVVDGRTTAGPIRVRLRRSDGDAGPAAVRG